MTEQKIHRLWKPIAFENVWRAAETSILDDLSSAWFARRATLRLDSNGLFSSPPHLVSIADADVDAKAPNLISYLEGELTVALAQVYKLLD